MKENEDLLRVRFWPSMDSGRLESVIICAMKWLTSIGKPKTTHF